MDVNPLGPVHKYVAQLFEVRFKVFPAHIGLLLPAVGVGKAFIITFVDALAVHPFADTKPMLR